MDQTKFINTYVANLAERLKALTLDNIMLSTQLTLANETNVGLTQRVEILEHEANQPKPNGNYVGLEGDLEFGTSEDYSTAENEDVDVNNSTNKKK